MDRLRLRNRHDRLYRDACRPLARTEGREEHRLCVGGSGRSSIDCVAVGVRVLDDVYLDKLYMEVSGRRLGRKGRNGRKGRREEIFLKHWSLGNLYSIDKRGRRMK